MEATNTRLKLGNREKEEIRFFSGSLSEVAYEPFNEFGKNTHMLKCVNCNHRFFDVCAVAGTGYREGGEN